MKKTAAITPSPVLKKSIVFVTLLLGATIGHATTEWTTGLTGIWNSGGNWSNGVPGSPDNTARMHNGGVINVNSLPPNGGGVIDFRMNQTGNTSVNTVNWNPGSGGFTFNRLWVGDRVNEGAAAFNQDSGTITTTSADWFHIGRQGAATYTMNNNATAVSGGRLSIAQGNSGTDTSRQAYLIMNGSSSFTQLQNTESYVGRQNGARANLIMNDGSTGTFRQLNVARHGTSKGTFIMNDNAVATVNNGLRFARFDTAAAILELNGNAQLTSNNGTGFSQENNRSSTTEVFMNGNSRFTSNSWFEMGGGQATFTMSDSSFLDSNQSTVIGMRNASSAPGDGITRFIVDDNATADLRGNTTWIGHETSSRGQMEIIGDGARVFNSNLSVGRNGAATVNQSAGYLRADNWLVIGLQLGGTGSPEYNISGGILDAARIQVGERSAGVLNVSGTGYVTVDNDLDIAASHAGQTDNPASFVNQSGGTVVVGGRLSLAQEVSGGGQGTYNLTGGTLRANDIQSNGNIGTFNWGAGTLTMEEVRAGNGGAGTTINYEGNLATGAVGSTLDLGDLYSSAGTNYDKLNVTGDLDLTQSGDVLEFWDFINLLRPGGNGTFTGEKQLISVGGTFTGQFDTVIGPSSIGQFFRTYQTGGAGIPSGTLADALQRNSGYVDYRADGVYFVYKIGGQIPEPQTTAFLFFGVVLLRGYTVMKRNSQLRRKMVK